MLPEPLLIFLTLIVPVGLTGCIFYILRAHKLQETKLNTLQNEKNTQEQKSNEQVQKILEQARIQAIQIISAANESAKQILLETNSVKGKNEEQIQKELEELSQKQEKAFQKATEDMTRAFQDSIIKIGSEDINIVKNLTKNIEDNVTKDIADFKSILEQETITSQKIVGEKIENQYESVRNEVDSYKNEEIKKVDQSIQELIQKTAEQVIHKSLTLENHYELVQQALEQAKAELHLTPPEAEKPKADPANTPSQAQIPIANSQL